MNVAVALERLMRRLVRFGRMVLHPLAVSAYQRVAALETAGSYHRQRFVLLVVRGCTSKLGYSSRSPAAVAGLVGSRVETAKDLLLAQKGKTKPVLGKTMSMLSGLLQL